MTRWPQGKNDAISEALGEGNPDSISGVLDLQSRLQVLLAALTDNRPNGVAAFNSLYTVITRGVLDGVNGSAVTVSAPLAGKLSYASGVVDYDVMVLESRSSLIFKDVEFMKRLDVEFAALYFDALRYWTSDSPTPKCWEILFDNWDNPGLSELGGAILGVNAHVNHDLPRAVVATSRNTQVRLEDGSDQHDDFLIINDIFRRSLGPLKKALEADWFVDLIGRLMGNVDDWVQLRAIIEARNIAWEHAQNMTRLEGAEFEEYCRELDTWAERLAHVVLAAE